jgi:hypothetical protein
MSLAAVPPRGELLYGLFSVQLRDAVPLWFKKDHYCVTSTSE